MHRDSMLPPASSTLVDKFIDLLLCWQLNSSILLERDAIPCPMLTINCAVQPLSRWFGIKLFAPMARLQMFTAQAIDLDRFNVLQLLLQVRLDGVQFY